MKIYYLPCFGVWNRRPKEIKWTVFDSKFSAYEAFLALSNTYLLSQVATWCACDLKLFQYIFFSSPTYATILLAHSCIRLHLLENLLKVRWGKGATSLVTEIVTQAECPLKASVPNLWHRRLFLGDIFSRAGVGGWSGDDSSELLLLHTFFRFIIPVFSTSDLSGSGPIRGGMPALKYQGKTAGL